MKFTSIKYIFLAGAFCFGLKPLNAQTGIGTSDPQGPLHIVDAGFPQLTITSASGVDSATIGVDSVGSLNITTAGQGLGNIIFKPKGALGIGTTPEKLFSIGNDTDRFSLSVSGSKLQVWNDANPPVMVFEFDSAGTNGYNALRTTSNSDMNISMESGSSNESMIFQTQDSTGALKDRIIIDNFTNTSAVDIVNADLDVDNGVYHVDSKKNKVSYKNSDPQSIMDFSNATEPIIVPRLTFTQRTTLGFTAHKGEIVYDYLFEQLYVFNGTIWKPL